MNYDSSWFVGLTTAASVVNSGKIYCDIFQVYCDFDIDFNGQKPTVRENVLSYLRLLKMCIQ